MSLLKSERGKERYIDRSQILLQERKLNRSSVLYNQSKLAEIQQKMKMFGGLEQMEEQFLKDLNINSQRLEHIVTSVKQLIKVDPKTKRTGVSPFGKAPVRKGVEKDKSNKRLIERVEKAIYEQPSLFSK